MKISCGSWLILDKATGKPIAETFNPKIAGAINTQKYEIKCAYQYLTEFNRKVKSDALRL